jgi:hypothetical protein
MDWIERLLDFAPDDGDGSLELIIVVVSTLCAVAAVAYHPRARQAVRNLFGRIGAELTKSR